VQIGSLGVLSEMNQFHLVGLLGGIHELTNTACEILSA
jgi:hypothetical protein